MLHPGRKPSTANLSEELQSVLSYHPEFLNSEQHLEFLRYGYFHYINCDPISRELPLQEKLKQANEMTNNFMGIVIGAKG